jgi:hypothetical protein
LQRLIEDIDKHNPSKDSSGVVGWNGSHQIAQRVLMHEAERLALPALDHAQLVARLERALGQLGELSQPRREAWEDVIRSLLAAEDGADNEPLEHTYRAYLDEILGEIYEASNGNAIQLAGFTIGLPGSSWSPCSRWGCSPDLATACCWATSVGEVLQTDHQVWPSLTPSPRPLILSAA